LKDFNIQHFNQNATTNFDCLLINKYIIITNHVTCVQYFKHNMNNFCRLLKNIDILFGQIVDFFLLQNFDMEGWHLTMVYYGWKICLNLVFHQINKLQFLLIYIWQLTKPFLKRNFRIHKHTNISEHAKKKKLQIFRFQYPNPSMKCTKNSYLQMKKIVIQTYAIEELKFLTSLLTWS
jgi:hypothetical protein